MIVHAPAPDAGAGAARAASWPPAPRRPSRVVVWGAPGMTNVIGRPVALAMSRTSLRTAGRQHIRTGANGETPRASLTGRGLRTTLGATFSASGPAGLASASARPWRLPMAQNQVRLDIQRREPFAGGIAFGETGSYERLLGNAHFAIDPA